MQFGKLISLGDDGAADWPEGSHPSKRAVVK